MEAIPSLLQGCILPLRHVKKKQHNIPSVFLKYEFEFQSELKDIEGVGVEKEYHM